MNMLTLIRNGGAPQLRRAVDLFSATNIVIANIIGAGIFTTSGIMAGILPGPSWVLACWIAGGLLAMAGALCYGELATRMPEEGAEYEYLKTLYHPMLGFLTGWTSFVVGFSAPIAASAMGFAEYLSAGLNGRFGSLDPAVLSLGKKAVAIAFIVLFTGIHSAGIRLGSRVQNVLTIIKVAMLASLAAAGLAAARKGLVLSGAPAGSLDWTSLGTAMMLVMFAYSGWNASAYIAGELRDPRRTLPRSLVIGTAIVIAIYVAVNLFILGSVPYDALKGAIPVVERAAEAAFGGWMGRTLGIIVAFALLSSMSAFILIGPRVPFAMARDRLFFRFAAKVHERSGVPVRSIAIQGGIAVVMVMLGTFEQLLVYLGFALGIFPWLAVAGIFIARRRGVGDASAVRVPGYPLVPLFFLAGTLGLLVVAFIGRPLESSAALGTVALGIPCYAAWMRAHRRNPRAAEPENARLPG
jgi:APA family basic amino acid/polyamine antiporter